MWPKLTSEDRAAVCRVIERGQLACGPEVPAFEQEWAEFTGAQHCVAVNGGTSALHIALAACGVGSGSKVIVPALSYVGSYQPVLALQAQPLFLDVDRETFNLDATSVEEALQAHPDVRAVMAVHLHGNPCELDRLASLCIKYGVDLVEDACQAHGASYQDRQVGTWGRVGCFSLNHTKPLPAGEGGMLVTDDSSIDRFARMFRYTGEDLTAESRTEPIRVFLTRIPGLNYLMPELTAAVARSQLHHLPDVLQQGRENAELLDDRFLRHSVVHPQRALPMARSIYSKYRVVLDPWPSDLWATPVEAVRHLRKLCVPAAIWGVRPLPCDPVFGTSGRWPDTWWVLNHSFILGDEEHPLFAVDKTEVEQWADVLEEMLG